MKTILFQGDSITDAGRPRDNLYARIKMDILNLKPDIMSILIGINDVWHDVNEVKNGVDAEKYYKIYCMLIEPERCFQILKL